MTATTPSQAQRTGLFLVAYQIGEARPGAVLFTVHLLVNTPNERISGFGRVTQAINPPLDLSTKLEGDFTYMTVMPPSGSHILVTATGYPVTDWPPHAGVGPVLLSNVELRAVLAEDWQSGTANFRYRTGDDLWHQVSGAPMHVIAHQGATENRVILSPKSATATYHPDTLTIRASGTEDGVGDITIVRETPALVPPVFVVEGTHSPAIGMFPYDVEAPFDFGTNPKEVILRTPSGDQRIPVQG